MKPERGFAEVNGARLYYEVAGSGPPLVLLHGSFLDTRMWDNQVEAFARRYTVIRYDARGFGRSAFPSGLPYARSDDLKGLLESLAVARACLVGLSMGAGVAIDFAVSFPERVDALVLVAAGLGGFSMSSEYDAWLQGIRSSARRSGIRAARKALLAGAALAPALTRPPVAAHLVRMVSDYSGWHWVNDDPVQRLAPPAVQRLEHIAAPTLIVVGERDLPDFHAIADVLFQRVPHARKVVLPGVGHLPCMEDPEEFNQIVLEFLASVAH